MDQTQVTDRFEEIVPPSVVRVDKHTASDVQERIRLRTVENIAR